MNASRCALLCIWMLAACASYLVAQIETASLSGRVTDPQGAVVAQATIEVIEQGTGVLTRTETNRDGLYYLPSLQPGNYREIVTKQGFKQIVQAQVKLSVQDALTVNFSLEIGSVAETVTVNGENAQIRTQDASVSTLITSEQTENMPLNGRSLQSLIMLAPGMTLAPASTLFSDTANPGQFSSNGARSYSNYFMVDGVSANAGTDTSGSPSGFAGAQPALTNAGTTQNLVSIDALQEFRIQTSTYSPEFGRSPGAQIELLTRSGNNHYHGTLSEYLRNDALDAADWFEHALDIPKPALRQNDFGGTFGGPIRLPGFNGKNRTFFFFSYEGLRVRQPTFENDFVPALDARQTAAPAIQPYLNAFPLPTSNVDLPDSFTGLPSGFAPFAKGFSNTSNSDTWSLRLDHHFNNRISIFGRYSDSTSNGKTRMQANITSNTQSNQAATVGATILLNANLLDELRLNFSRSTANSSSTLDTLGGAAPVPNSLAFPAPFAAFKTSTLFVQVAGDIAGPAYSVGTAAANIQRQFNLVDSFSITKGKHEMKFGVDYRRLFPIVGPTFYSQSLDFTAAPTSFDPNDDLTQGEVSFFNIATQRSHLEPVFINLSLYGQDTWRVTPRFTMTYGLRWEFNPVPHNSNGLDPQTLTGLSGPTTFDLAPAGTPIYPTRYNDFAPRLGFAYELKQQPGWHTVLRAGAGVFYDLGSTEVAQAFMSYPLQANFFLIAPPIPGSPDPTFPVPRIDYAPPIPTLDGAFFNVYDPNFHLPKTIEWNASMAQSLGKNQTLTTSYVGSLGRHLLQVYPYIQPNAKINGTVEVYRTNSTSDYDAFQVEYQRTVATGLQALASYTWSHSLDNASDDGLFLSQSSRGNSNFDIRQTLSASVSYTVPTWSKNKATRAIFGGWGLDTIVHLQTALPIDIAAGNATFTPTGQNFIVRPDIVPGQPFYLSGNQCPSLDLTNLSSVFPCPGGRRINPAAFVIPPEPEPPAPASNFREGDLGRNVLRGFGLAQADLAVRREFKLGEKPRMQFRIDAFNLANHPNFGSISNFLFNPNFGEAGTMYGGGFGNLNTLYQVGGPRSLQLSLKLTI